MNEWSRITLETIKDMGGDGVLIGLALIAALAQAASADRPSLKGFFVGLPMSFFVVWMAWLGLSHWGLNETMRVFWSGMAAFGAPWILRGINRMLHKFMEDPVSFLVKIKSVWGRK
ncbi:TPA: hypothetical protein SIA35_004243 [Aeromonas sobria]|nr:hypothetical protein [Aeromonas sobria]